MSAAELRDATQTSRHLHNLPYLFKRETCKAELMHRPTFFISDMHKVW